MNDSIEDKIDAYIQNRMSTANRKEFEEELSNNEELRNDVKSVEKLKQSYARKDLSQLKDKLDQIDKELLIDAGDPQSVNVFKRYKFLSIAASIIILLGLGYFVLQNQKSNELAHLFEENTPFQKYVTRSDSNPLASFNELLQDKQYQEVIKQVDGLLTNNNELNDELVLVLEQGKAYSLIALQDYSNATQILEAKNDCYSIWLKWCLAKKSKVGNAQVFLEKLSESACQEYKNTTK